MPEEVNRVVADHLSRWLFAPTPTAVANLANEGITTGVTLVGDLMEDLVARTGPEIREPAVLGGIGRTLGIDLRPGRFLFATIHRAENREPAALRAWAGVLEAVASPDRPVVLALHPGTRAALGREGVSLARDVLVVPPLGYRSSLALQLHAAAVLTDSGGVQREAAWLGTPCLVLRGTTEWVEAVADSGGRMVVVGLDPERAAAELARLAPVDRAEEIAGSRARDLALRPAGAAEAIVAALEGDLGDARS
jgi:UDP-N-acetylglucosamine 2-epimerase